MNQAELFPVDPPALAFGYGGYVPPAGTDEDCRQSVLGALEFYQDDSDTSWEPDTEFDAGQIAAMVTCNPAGPFCIAVLPVFQLYGVSQVQAALNQLAQAGKVNKQTRYFGSRSPAECNYRGYGYRYSLPDKGVSDG